MDNLFSFSLTFRLPVYTMTLVLSTVWEGFGKGRGGNDYWKDFALGFLTISFIHRKRYDDLVSDQLLKMFGNGTNGIRVVRLDKGEQLPTQADPVVNKDTLN